MLPRNPVYRFSVGVLHWSTELPEQVSTIRATSDSSFLLKHCGCTMSTGLGEAVLAQSAILLCQCLLPKPYCRRGILVARKRTAAARDFLLRNRNRAPNGDLRLRAIML